MTKDSVLALLKKSDSHLSGEAISKELGITRAAVNQAVEKLRAEGYVIDSAPRRGYRLLDGPDALTLGELAPFLPAARLKSVRVFPSIDSTNTALRQAAFEGAKHGSVFIANEQTKGRGRTGRSFVSPKDSGIYLSYLLRPEGKPEEMNTITARAAVAMRRAIKTVAGVAPDIKWVNDLLLNQKKIAGILTEMSLEAEGGAVQHIIIGVGVNVCQTKKDFPGALRKVASSIAEESGLKIPRAKLAAAMITELDKLAAHLQDADAADFKEYRAACVTTGRDVRVVFPNAEKEARVLSLNRDYTLTVQYTDGSKEKLSSGEVHVRGLLGYV